MSGVILWDCVNMPPPHLHPVALASPDGLCQNQVLHFRLQNGDFSATTIPSTFISWHFSTKKSSHLLVLFFVSLAHVFSACPHNSFTWPPWLQGKLDKCLRKGNEIVMTGLDQNWALCYPKQNWIHFAREKAGSCYWLDCSLYLP